jgi:hypothetical protein
VRNYNHWAARGEALRREIAAMRATAKLARFDNDDGSCDAGEARIREAEAQLKAIETMLAGR